MASSNDQHDEDNSRRKGKVEGTSFGTIRQRNRRIERRELRRKVFPFFFFCTDEFINARAMIIVAEEGYSSKKSDMFVYGCCMLTVE